jgi:hypothetical protein
MSVLEDLGRLIATVDAQKPQVAKQRVAIRKHNAEIDLAKSRKNAMRAAMKSQHNVKTNHGQTSNAQAGGVLPRDR